MYSRVLAGRENILGPEDLDTVGTVSNLGIVYSFQGRYNEAEIMYGRALAGREKCLGSEHLTTVKTVECLAILYRYRGRYWEAEQLHLRSLAERTKALGSEHPDTLRILENLGRAAKQYRRARLIDGELHLAKMRVLQPDDQARTPRFRDSPVICGRRFLTCYGGPIGTRDKSILYERWRRASHWYLIIKALDVQTVQEWVPMQFQYNNYKDITARAGKTGDESIKHANTATTSETRLSRTGVTRRFR